MKYIKIDYTGQFSSLCNTKNEVIEGCGYDIDEITFEQLLETIKGEYEIIEVDGNINWLNR
jgi:hypothetical protein